jgi:hypothetical protein
LAWWSRQATSLATNVLPNPALADAHDVGSFGEERQVIQAQEVGFGLQAATAVLAVKGVDAGWA